MVRMIHSFRSFHSLTTRSVALSVCPAASLAPHGGMGGIGHLWGIRTVQLVRQVCSFQSFHSLIAHSFTLSVRSAASLGSHGGMGEIGTFRALGGSEQHGRYVWFACFNLFIR